MENIYFTIFSIQAFIPTVFAFAISLFFLIALKGQSKAAFHLGIVCLLFGSIPLTYVLASSYYIPEIAYNRWISAFISFPTILHAILFFYNFPEPINPKTAKRIFIFGWIFLGIYWVYFIYSSIHAKPIYNFTGHFYDLDFDQKTISITILIGAFILYGIGIWRTTVSKGKRLVMGGITSGYILATLGSATANVLSREGIITRGQFMTVYNISFVTGIFIIVIIFINNTKDKTSFLVKIIGISLVTFLLVIHLLTSILLLHSEENFDENYSKLSAMATSDDFNTVKSAYIYKFDPVQYQYLETNLYSNHTIESAETFNTYLFDKINSFEDDENFKENVKKVLSENQNIFFEGYKKTLDDILEANEGVTKIKLLNGIRELESKASKLRFKIKKLSVKDYEKQLNTLLEKNLKSYPHLSQSIYTHLEKNESLEMERMNVLKTIAPFQGSKNRLYRERSDGSHFISYLVTNLNKNIVYEVGFNYLEYRKYMHTISSPILLILIFAILFIGIGFRFFFQGTLLNPLESLLLGLRKVKKGNLDINLHVYVEDEIGFLTRSFNDMVKSIKDAKIKLEEYANHLEDKVKERTEELTKSLNEIQTLKSQQDGDYFLTSLLIKPLGRNLSKSDRVEVKSIVSQKKKFNFKKWNSEIGGDICIAYSIKLNNRPLTLFLNADAMGKSVQGAGGALVVGSVFQSIVERTSLSSQFQNISPEKWLKNSFIELHKVFESFDGSMLISLVLGLVEDDNGFMYFINAEHPFTILYRDGMASFIENEMYLRKLGTMGSENQIIVQTFQMEPGDKIIVGSDGRDDLLLSRSEDGQRVINEDETLILKHIEKGKGDLEEIFQIVKKTGEITDDFSLLSIYYKEYLSEKNYSIDVQGLLMQANELFLNKQKEEAISILEEANKKEPNNTRIMRFLINLYIRYKEYSRASDLCGEYTVLRPWETEYLYNYALCLKKNGEYEKSIEVGERIKIREPNLVRNLINLAECYYAIKNFEKTKQFIRLAERLERNNTKLQKISKLVYGEFIEKS